MWCEVSCISTVYQPDVQAAPGNVCASVGPDSAVLGAAGSPTWSLAPGICLCSRKGLGLGYWVKKDITMQISNGA